MRSLAKISLIALAIMLPLSARAADIHLLTPPNMKAILNDLTPDYERASGNKLIIDYAPVPEVKIKVAAGHAADVAISLRSVVDDLNKAGKVTSETDVGRSFIGIAVKAGAAKPDIGTLDALKRTLLAAKSITYSDPPKGGISGVFFSGLVARMGLADQLKDKTKLVPPGGGPLVALVASGGAELGVDQLSSLVNKPGLDVVGKLPKEADVDIVMTAGVVNDSTQPAAAAGLVKFLASPAAAGAIKKHGMEPG
jgi:molybdate transport system substrate-binding protein